MDNRPDLLGLIAFMFTIGWVVALFGVLWESTWQRVTIFAIVTLCLFLILLARKMGVG